MLYRSPRSERQLILGSSDRLVGGAGGWGRLTWLRGQHTDVTCPVCATSGQHPLVLSVPSSITPDAPVIFARCRQCNCSFVTGYQTPAYEAAGAQEAPLRFYVEQGAGMEFLARSVFVAAQRPVKNYLDIGCGFGFGPDMATRIFGWNALGIDPGALAAAGREMLGVRIDSDLLSPEKSLAGAPYDAIVGMEVIEHIAEPYGFLSAVRNNLADAGVFILSTPNGRYLDADPDGDLLMPLLSPGYHAVLYTAEGLAGVLRQAGFHRVNVTQTAASLFAAASPSGTLPRLEIRIDRGRYVEYLRCRFREAPTESTIYTGFGYRLLRCLIEDQAYHEALNVFHDLRAAILTRHGLDIDRPLDIAERVMEQEVAFADVPGRFPFCLAGLLFYRGSIAADHEGRAELAASYFLATRFSAQMLLCALQVIGISDGDLAALPARAASALTELLQVAPGCNSGGRGGDSSRGQNSTSNSMNSSVRLLYP
jgi:2-polyprenyl-3-methyl-5-hydroxy-6-metoxy-1,4-benzoquinol methylase